MFTLKIRLTADAVDMMKSDLRRRLPHIQSAHRAEATARGLGFNTHAALLAELRLSTSLVRAVEPAAFVAFLAERGWATSQAPLWRAAARVAIRDVMLQEPLLQVDGLGFEGKRLTTGSAQEAPELTDIAIKISRDALDGLGKDDEFLRAIATLSRLSATAEVRDDAPSYLLKELAEKLHCALPDGEALGPSWVSNGALIAAAIHLGLACRRRTDADGVLTSNVSLNLDRSEIQNLFEAARREEQERRYGLADDADLLDRTIFDAILNDSTILRIEPDSEGYVEGLETSGGLASKSRFTDRRSYERLRTDAKRRAGIDPLSEGPQTGVFLFEKSGVASDVAVATRPTRHGDDITMRLIDPDGDTGRDVFAMSHTDIDLWRLGLSMRSGVNLVCGVAGSGKDRTLLASAKELAAQGRTVRYLSSALEESQASAQGTPAADDVVVLGALRDGAAIKRAFQAAGDGQTVLASVTAATFQEGVNLLMSHVTSSELNAHLKSVAAQALLRTKCGACKGEGRSDHSGCVTCRGVGYADLTLVSEVWCFGTDAAVIDRLRDRPWPSMFDDAIDKMAAGVTSLEELRRIFGVRADRRIRSRGLDPEAYKLRRALTPA